MRNILELILLYLKSSQLNDVLPTPYIALEFYISAEVPADCPQASREYRLCLTRFGGF
jgi:hypothetical protein